MKQRLLEIADALADEEGLCKTSCGHVTCDAIRELRVIGRSELTISDTHDITITGGTFQCAVHGYTGTAMCSCWPLPVQDAKELHFDRKDKPQW